MLDEERRRRIKEEASQLVATGRSILLAHRYRLSNDDIKGDRTKLDELDKKFPLKSSYQGWYSKCLSFISVFGRDRLDEFKELYLVQKRKDLDPLTYGISDYLQAVATVKNGKEERFDTTFISKMTIQIDIMNSLVDRVGAIFEDLHEQIQHDILQSELASAGALLKSGFIRAAGALAGVALEAHLRSSCLKQSMLPKKRDPTLNDLSESLKTGDVIDTAQWRFLQHLADVRNKCVHKRSAEPTSDEVRDLIAGVVKVTRTI